MIIQSKFHDYYDSFAGQYPDKKIIYKRENALLNKSIIPKEITQYLRQDNYIIGVGYESINVLLFCGKIYPFYYKKDYTARITVEIRDFKNPYSYFPEPEKNNFSFIRTPIYLPEYDGKGIENNEALRLCQEIAPIISIEYNGYDVKVMKNPRLSDIKFHLHSFEVYQDLLQFLSPVEPEMAEIADKFKIISHGMDDTSFRREKGGPTRKRKKLINQK